MNIAIIEDEIEQQTKLRDFLSRFFVEKRFPIDTKIYKDGESFLSEYKKGQSDLIFMDIELGNDHLNGMEISKKLREIDSDVLLIFVTNLAQFAVEGYSVDAMDFIVKPIQYEPFRMKMEKAFRIFLSKNQLKNILISVDNGNKKILANDIYYVEVSNHDIFFHTKEGEYSHRSSMKAVMQRLTGLPFRLCNSCYLINLKYVERIEKDQVVMQNGEKLKIAKSRKKDFLADLGNYLSGDFR